MKKYIIISLTLCMMFGIFSTGVEAYNTTKIENLQMSGDFLVSPANLDLRIVPGTKSTFSLKVLNRTGKEAKFAIGVEDIVSKEGSLDNELELLGDRSSS